MKEFLPKAKCKIGAKPVTLIWLVGTAVFFALAYLFQFGPPGIKSGEDLVLASTHLADGSRVFIVAHRTGHFVEAYEVTLYRVWTDEHISLNWLGYEDGYWWLCNLKPGKSGILEIHAFGKLMAEYEISTGDVRWEDNGSVLQSYKVSELSYTPKIPEMILQEAGK